MSGSTFWVQNKFAIIDELMQIGRQEVVNKLNPIITQETLTVNIKYVPQYKIESSLAVLTPIKSLKRKVLRQLPGTPRFHACTISL